MDAAEAPSHAVRMLGLVDAGIEQRLGDGAIDREARVERIERVLEHELRLRGGRRAGARPSARRARAPSKAMVPAVGSVSFSISRPSVVLPQPDSPTMAIASPAPMSRLDAVERVHGRVLAAHDLAQRARRPGSASRRREARRALPCGRIQWQALRRCVGLAVAPGRPRACVRRARRWRSDGAVRQRAAAKGQRGAKRQPGGGSRRSGGLPSIGTSSIASDSRSGKALRRPIV